MGADRPSVQAQGFAKVGLPVHGHRHATPPPPPSLPGGRELLIHRPRKARPGGSLLSQRCPTGMDMVKVAECAGT